MNNNWEKQYIKDIKNKIKKRVLIYGAGKVGRIIYKLCLDNNITVDGFCVTNKEENCAMVNNLPVYQFDELVYDPETILILIGIQERGKSRISSELLKADWKNYIETPLEILFYDSLEEYRKKRPTMEITPKVGCAVNCKYCPQHLFISRYFSENENRIGYMTFEDYKCCLDKLPTNTLIVFAGFAEPFLNPDSIRMMEYTKEQGFEMDLFTTLVGLDKEDFLQIKNIPFQQVVLHTPDVKAYANIPITDEYLEVLDMILDSQKADGSMYVDSANCQSSPHPIILEHTKGRLKIYTELTDRAGNLGNNESLASAHKKGKIICERALNLDHNILLPDGTVVLCCNDFGMKHVLGNLLEDEYDDIINGEEMQRIRKAMEEGKDQDLLCRACIYAIEIK